MRPLRLLLLPLVALLSLSSSAHYGVPPSLPSLDESAPATILASATAVDIVGSTWCAYEVVSGLACKKNGSYVTLSLNSTTTNSPHAFHVDKTFNVNLVPLHLAHGDVLVWEFTARAISGPNAGTNVTISRTSQVN